MHQPRNGITLHMEAISCIILHVVVTINVSTMKASLAQAAGRLKQGRLRDQALVTRALLIPDILHAAAFRERRVKLCNTL